jgi:uridylate kinase
VRILVKASGQTLAGPDSSGFDPDAVSAFAREIIEVARIAQVAVVIGGGNILRGSDSGRWQIDRVEADNVGMLGTAINSLLLRGSIVANSDLDVRMMSALPMPSVAEPYIRLRANRHLEKGRIVILACGTGQPFQTTDYPSVQRACELDCDLLIAAKNGVDGIYEADPKADPTAKRYIEINYDDVISRGLKVMDPGAFLLAREFKLPIRVVDSTAPGAMAQIAKGEKIGTYVGADAVTRLA